MTNICSVCNKLIEDGSEVTVMVIGKYKSLGSTNTWALKDNTLKFYTDTIAHTGCYENEKN